MADQVEYAKGQRPAGALERSLASLTIGMMLGQAERVKSLADTATGEYEQKYYLPLSGIAALAPVYADKQIAWELPFVYAPTQRRDQHPTPHFIPGIEITSGQGNFIDVRAQVIRWTITEEGWFVGATIRCAVSAPLAGEATFPFSAIAHLRFQGFATMAETGEFAQ